MDRFPSETTLCRPGQARILPRALAFVLTALVGTLVLSAETDPYVGDTIQHCPQAAEFLASSEVGEVEWSAWLVSGAKTGTARRFPEKTDPYGVPRVTVEYLKAESFVAQSLSGIQPDGQSWMIWFDKENGCVLLTGSPDSLTGGDASLQAPSATQRVFRRGDLELVLTLDEEGRAEDTKKRADGSTCNRGNQCQSSLCVGGVCRKANGAACTASVQCASNQCAEEVCKP